MTTATQLIDALLKSPCTSRWLHRALTDALDRDCVDAARDAELLAEVLRKRTDTILNHAARYRSNTPDDDSGDALAGRDDMERGR